MVPCVIFLHGLESGPHGSKWDALRGAGWSVEAPDCTGVMDVTVRVNRARVALESTQGPVVLVGSSFGGLTALLLLSEIAGTALAKKVVGLVLCAPALHRAEATGVTAVPSNTHILHGTHDDVVPIEASRAFAKTHGLEVTETDDGHRLSSSTAEMLRLTKLAATS